MTARQRLEWTRGFIRDFGWGEYWRVCWRDVWLYRLRNWRCWFGHDLGPPIEWGYEAWSYCQRPGCEFCVRVD